MSETPNQHRPAPEGWAIQSMKGNFAWHAGPFYFREAGPTPGVAFFSEPHHANKADSIHGGALLTLADMSLFDICHRKLGAFKAVTITLNTEFLAPAPIGVFIEATGEMTGGGRKLLIARGIVSTGGQPLVSFSGTLRRFE
ncbi:MAG: PaaI family thioesterase [Parvularculaceae bacterium]|jgi:acyl-coenzyme A thioesterase PaaI-like protein|nr:PaaI family thioesterase [Parvularculaceae bacterium]